MNHVRIVTVALAVSSLSVMIACSGTSITPDEEGTYDPNEPVKPAPSATSGTTKGDGGSAPSTSTGSSGGTKTDGGGTTTPDAGTSSSPDPAKVACFANCTSNNPQGFDEFSAILQPCACAPSVCGTICGTSCTAPGATAADLLGSASAACRTCVQDTLANGAVCNTAMKQQCIKKAHCPGFAICSQGCL